MVQVSTLFCLLYKGSHNVRPNVNVYIQPTEHSCGPGFSGPKLTYHVFRLTALAMLP